MGRLLISGQKWLPVLLLLALVGAYSNHFGNGFHFDDFHTINDNPHIRKLSNIPAFFRDPGLFSALPTHQVYRPLVTTSLAVDYHVGGGLQPWAFHASTFFWYCVYIGVLWLWYRRLLPGPEPLALLAAAVYGLHPVSAETVNYIIQRGDLYSTLGVCAALLSYAAWPGYRRYGLYLIPFVLACLSKPPALVFPLLLLLYLRLYENVPWTAALRRIAPALAVTVAMALLLRSMTAATFNPGAGSREAYWITQTWVALGYFQSFFRPVHLSADTDAALLVGLPAEAWAGFVFVAGLLAAILHTTRTARLQPIGFGLGWFVIALLPTSLMPLAEVANDHRMFFPFAGLAPAAVWTVWLLLQPFGRRAYALAGVAACLILAASAMATRERNEVWRSEETLWRDVTRKSPRNGRGWMNYGLTLMARGDYQAALACFDEGRKFTPNYALLEVNTGIVKAALQRHTEAEPHFRRALQLSPDIVASHFYYARWLVERKRTPEAMRHLDETLRIQPGDLAARHLLMQVHFQQQNWNALRPLAEQTLRLDPGDAISRSYLDSLATANRQVDDTEIALRASPTPEGYLNLSLLYYRAGRYEDCIRAARRALELRPNYAEAWNNIAAGYNSLGRWDEGIAAGREAVRLAPNNDLARNNLAWALSQKSKGTR